MKDQRERGNKTLSSIALEIKSNDKVLEAVADIVVFVLVEVVLVALVGVVAVVVVEVLLAVVVVVSCRE